MNKHILSIALLLSAIPGTLVFAQNATNESSLQQLPLSNGFF